MKIVIIIAVFLLSCNQSSNQPSNKQRIIPDNTQKYKKICIEDHIYYSSGNKLALKVNDNGLPVKCDKLNLK